MTDEVRLFPKMLALGRALTEEPEYVPHGQYIVTEKLDGSNAGILRTPEGLVPHSRSRQMSIIHPDGTGPEVSGQDGLRGFHAYVRARASALYDALEPGEHIYGEWLVPHTVKYPDQLYNQFYLFPHPADERLQPIVPHAPRIGTLAFTGDTDAFRAEAELLLMQYTNRVGRDVEGVVLRAHAYTRTGVGLRDYKLVSDKFREAFAKTWAKPEKIARSSGDIAAALAADYSGRSYQKLRERLEDEVGRRLDMTDTPRVLESAWSDFATEHLPRGLKRLKWPTVDTRALRGELFERVRAMYHGDLDGRMPQWALQHEHERA